MPSVAAFPNSVFEHERFPCCSGTSIGRRHLDKRCLLQSIGLSLPDLQTKLHQRSSKLFQEPLDAQLSKAGDLQTVLAPLLVGAQRGDLPLALPLPHGLGRLIVRGPDRRRDHVEGGALGVAATGLEEDHVGELHKAPQQEDGVEPLDLVEQDDHGAAGPQVLESQGELGQEEAAGLAVVAAVLGPLVGAAGRAVAEDEVEVAAVLEVSGVQEAGVVGVRSGDLVWLYAHVGGEHGDVEVVDLDGLALAHDGDKTSLRRGEGEGHGVGGGVALEGFGEVGARCHAEVEDALVLFL